MQEHYMSKQRDKMGILVVCESMTGRKTTTLLMAITINTADGVILK